MTPPEFAREPQTLGTPRLSQLLRRASQPGSPAASMVASKGTDESVDNRGRKSSTRFSGALATAAEESVTANGVEATHEHDADGRDDVDHVNVNPTSK